MLNDVEVDDKLTLFTSEYGDTICAFSSTNINTGYFCSLLSSLPARVAVSTHVNFV